MRDLAQDHVTLTSHAERLDATVSVQGDALATAKSIIKDLLPLHRALTYKDEKAFESCRAQATDTRYKDWIASYNTIEDRQTTTANERNILRDFYEGLP